MDVGIAEEQGEERKADPRQRLGRETFERYQENEAPDLSPDANVDPDIALKSFAQPSPKE